MITIQRTFLTSVVILGLFISFTSHAHAASLTIKATDGKGKTLSGVPFQCTIAPHTNDVVAGVKPVHTKVTTGNDGTAVWNVETKDNYRYSCAATSMPSCYIPEKNQTPISLSQGESKQIDYLFRYDETYCDEKLVPTATIKPANTITPKATTTIEPTVTPQASITETPTVVAPSSAQNESLNIFQRIWRAFRSMF